MVYKNRSFCIVESTKILSLIASPSVYKVEWANMVYPAPACELVLIRLQMHLRATWIGHCARRRVLLAHK